MSEIPDPLCTGCDTRAHEIAEYQPGEFWAPGEFKGPDDYVRRCEGTYNPENGHFLCTECYITAGMPSHPTGWVAP